ncbi:unnamed protein product [Spirodela intermedia]|uniref:Glycosyl transferase CAP10 domain-containing protein n=1 Tax=Spirodela intermedia TaxID=51605 RepID=A0A7I8K9U3_SPIIN|nr:unnamed protein product [Spirodela intermedia]
MVEKARAHFRLVIVDGRAYVEKYDRSFQTRDVFTQWGILQLLRRYPGKLPDLELMFDCNDHPRIPKSPAAGPPPPALFHYCGDDSTADITFPDWSFWGWPEVNIKPWEPLSAEMKAANRHLRWADREPYAYWKGNQWVDRRRQELLQCNVSDKQDWNARLYPQDWVAESQKGFENSDLARQCKHKYKIYIEGRAWSVSRKYIQACDSPALVVAPRYYEFFSRGMAPLRHYWPVRADAMCAAIKFAVDWGGHHQKEAQEIGRKGSSFVFEEVKMEYVYDYMLHLLTEYARLLRFKPIVPPGAVELCREELACPVEPLAREFMRQSEVRAPAAMPPCSLPPPMKPEEVKLLWAERANATHQVELLETRPLADSEKKP